MTTKSTGIPKVSIGSKPQWMKGVGPYIGRVVNHLDTEYMGGVEVEILKTSDSSGTENSGYVIPCVYVSPFAGQTPVQGLTKSRGFENTQKSYGFWAVPPDVGVKVLVLLGENNLGFGFWIGCIQDKFMNFMMPGNASTTYTKEGMAYKDMKLPVGEYNKLLESGTGNDPTKYQKAVDIKQADILQKQGLIDRGKKEWDEHRGVHSSSARRELPSMVFGWNTPGPYDYNGPKVPYSSTDHQTEVPFNRLGGSSFIMDDGDMMQQREKPPVDDKPKYKIVEQKEEGDVTIPHNEITRLKTRTGHQILMNNSEDFIYIINARGTAWVELTNNGKIDVYSYDSVSVHSEMDINLKAERDINLEASGNINFKAKEQMRMESGNATHWKVGTAETKKAPGERDKQREQDEDPNSPTYGDRKYRTFEDLADTAQPGDNLYIDVSRDVYWKVGTHPEKGDVKIEVSKDSHWTTDKEFRLYAKTHIHQKSDLTTHHEAKTAFHQKAGTSFHMQSGATMNLKSGAHLKLYAANNNTIKAGSNNYLDAAGNNHIKANSGNFMSSSTAHIKASVVQIQGMVYNNGSASPASPGSMAAGAVPPKLAILPECAHHAFIPVRIPMHEPYYCHENLDPNMFKPDKTDSTKSINDACEFAINYEQEDQTYILTPDTFRKGL